MIRCSENTYNSIKRGSRANGGYTYYGGGENDSSLRQYIADKNDAIVAYRNMPDGVSMATHGAIVTFPPCETCCDGYPGLPAPDICDPAWCSLCD